MSLEAGLAGANGRVHAVADLRAFLAGAWRIDRTVRDARLGQDGSFDGTAVFQETDDGLLLTETGTLRFGEHAGPAAQTYRYAFPDGAVRASVFRRDGSFFHDLDLSDGAAEALHCCGEDVYRGSFRAEGRDAWVVRWLVKGPRKDYDMVTRYSRVPVPGE